MTSDLLCVLAADYGRYNQPGYQQIAKQFSMAAEEIDRLTARVAELEQDETRRREHRGCIAGACPMCGRPLVIG